MSMFDSCLYNSNSEIIVVAPNTSRIYQKTSQCVNPSSMSSQVSPCSTSPYSTSTSSDSLCVTKPLKKGNRVQASQERRKFAQLSFVLDACLTPERSLPEISSMPILFRREWLTHIRSLAVNNDQAGVELCLQQLVENCAIHGFSVADAACLVLKHEMSTDAPIPDFLRILVECGALGTNSCLPLSVVRRADASSLLPHFVALGANVNARDRDGRTAVIACCERNRGDVLEILVQHYQANVELALTGAITPLMVASARGHSRCVLVVLHAQVDVNAVNASGETALFMAATTGRLDVVRILTAYGADVNTPDIYGLTPVMTAAENNHYTVVEHLVSAGAIRPVSSICGVM